MDVSPTQHDDIPPWGQLWQGMLIASIAHAIFIAANDLLSAELSWTGACYHRLNSQGTRGTLAISAAGIVAAFRDDDSPRAPWHGGTAADEGRCWQGLPPALAPLVQTHVLPYLLDEYEGVTRPMLTAALWATGPTLMAVEPWPAVLAHGGHLLAKELLPAEAALDAWSEECEFDVEQVHLLRTLVTRRLATPGPWRLTAADRHRLTRQGRAGLRDTRVVLAAIGIAVR